MFICNIIINCARSVAEIIYMNDTGQYFALIKYRNDILG